MAESVRIDKWLWAARFYKTRSLAAQAVTGGRAQLNGARVKPARAVQVGDEVEVNKDGYAYRVRVLGLAERRGPAKLAQTLYEEFEDSIAKRAALSEQHKLAAASMPHPQHRPDKKARRLLRGLKG